MMGYGGWGMMGGLGFFGLVTWIIVIVDLILVGIWLWRQINKNK